MRVPDLRAIPSSGEHDLEPSGLGEGESYLLLLRALRGVPSSAPLPPAPALDATVPHRSAPRG
eukprot:1119973-Alexandrium_andersonii.AAC.1